MSFFKSSTENMFWITGGYSSKWTTHHVSVALFHVTPNTGTLAVQWDLRDLVQCIAFNLGVLFTICKTRAGNIFCRLADAWNIKQTRRSFHIETFLIYQIEGQQ
jgi:hypothetical protein